MSHRSQLPPQSAVNTRKTALLEAEVERLRQELNQANMEKNEINSEYEKLTTICRSQRQQLHGIKQALAATTVATTTSPNKSASKTQPCSGLQQQGLFNKSSSGAEQNSWQAFPEALKAPIWVMSDSSKHVGTRNSHQNRSCATRSPVTTPVSNLKQSQCFSGSRNIERGLSSQPPGWAAF